MDWLQEHSEILVGWIHAEQRYYLHCGYVQSFWNIYKCLLLRMQKLLFTVWTYLKEQNLRMHFLLW